MITCPDCGSSMTEVDHKGVLIDRCDACGGVWFDRGELNPYLRDQLKNNPTIPDAPLVSGGPSRYSERGPLAAHVKGNPNARALGRFLAEHHKELESWRSLGEAASATSTRAGMLHFGLRAILPLGTERRNDSTPWTLLSLIAFHALIFGIQTLTGSSGLLISAGGFVPAEFFAGRDLHALLTSGFIHAGFFHLAGNMLFLWVFGSSLEGRFGPLKFLGLYVALEVSSNLIYALVHHDSTLPAVGSSGAVSGLMGAFLVLFPKDRIKTFVVATVVRVPAWIYLGIWICYQVLTGLLSIGAEIEGGVAWFAHIGGFAAGVALMIPLRVKEKTEQPTTAVIGDGHGTSV
jgi:membrane associated rhomboid family serine protease/Zn-finger nucleic acid-binding protein